MEYDAVIPAAGSGKRMGAGRNKLFLPLNGKPVIVWTLSVFEEDPRCRSVVLACKSTEMAAFQKIINHYQLNKVSRLVVGGQERQDSVYQAVRTLTGDGIVLVHDGARPFVSRAAIGRVTETAEKSGAAVLAVPVKDTIKLVRERTVHQTMDRSSLWAVQTPQAFRLSLLLSAYEYIDHRRISVTDDAAAVEKSGGTVTVVEGEENNIKLTTPEDLRFAEFLLRDERGREG